MSATEDELIPSSVELDEILVFFSFHIFLFANCVCVCDGL